jgi:LuxR family quorum sensing-dependent transcriptional regulator
MTKDMSGLRETIVSAIDEIGNAMSAPAVWGAMKAIAAGYGFQYMLVLKGADELAEQVSGFVLYNDMPQGFAERYDSTGFSPHNPLVTNAITEARPYTAAELWAMPLNVRQRRALAEIGFALDVRDGLMIPIRNQRGLEGIVLLGGKKPEMSPIVRSMLHILAHCAYAQAEAVKANPQKRHGLLSPREIECLRLAAAGKTDNEIGRILTISPRTTRFHIENAKKKLGVATRVQAVAEALKRKAIAA